MEKQNIIVVGGGVAGMFAAYALRKRGAEVKLLEANTCGQGCSWDAAGMLAPINELEFQELPLLTAGIAARELYAEVEADLGNIGLAREGTLEVGLRADDEGYLRRQFEFQQAQGLAVEWKSGRGLREIEPYLSHQIPAGIWSPADIQVDNRKLVVALREKLDAMGVTIRERMEVRSISVIQEHEANVRTGTVDFRCNAVVLATGTGKLSGYDLPFRIYPVRGEMISLRIPPFPFLTKTVRIRNKVLGNAYIVPKENRIICGSTSEEQGFLQENTAGGLLDILRKCYAAVPGIYELEVLETWAGLRPSTLSRLPIVDREPGRPVYHLNGLYRHGILLSPLLGEAMAQLILTGERRPEIESFRLPTA